MKKTFYFFITLVFMISIVFFNCQQAGGSSGGSGGGGGRGGDDDGITIINPTGTLDTIFDPGTGVNDKVFCITIQNNGKIIIGGNFSDYNGTGRNQIARINANGFIDTSFDPGTGTAAGTIQDISIQNDGKIIITGAFTSYRGYSRNRIARIDANGSLDTTLAPGTGADNIVNDGKIQNDGKIMIVGNFINFNGTDQNRVARINTNGSLDATFVPGATGANNSVSCLAIQSDGKIIIGGNFTDYNGTGRNRIARINANGSIDTTFDPGTGANGSILCLAIQSDGKIIIGGDFTDYNGTGRNRIARIK
jgi:uncharacterized delta-60 repeat protein